MSRIFTLGAIAGAGGSRYWYGGIQGTSSTTIFPFRSATTVGPNDEFLVCAQDESLGTLDTVIYKISSKGRLSWQKNVSGLSDLGGIDVNPAGTHFAVTGRVFSPAAAQLVYSPYVDDVSSSTWARTIATTGNASVTSVETLIDSSGNVFHITLHAPVSSAQVDTDGIRITKYDSSGNLLWGRSIYSTVADYNVWANDACLDINNDVIICGQALEIAGGTTDVIDFYVAKISGSAGTVTWQQRLTGTDLQGENTWSGVVSDASGNIFLHGYGHHATAAPEDDLITAKYNSAGTLQWQRRINTGTSVEIGRGIAMKSNGSVLVVSRSDGTADVSTIVNYDTNGNVLWQRKFTNFEILDLAVDSKDDMFVVGLSGAYNLTVFKLPSDGTKTGTYTLFGQSIPYATATGSTITSSFTSVTSPTITNATATNTTTTNTSATFSNLSRTYSSTGIPT